jgi:Asp-tRNA(Asn)/Glu-tRNA(Gln) amidotransferase A subunit family amidase
VLGTAAEIARAVRAGALEPAEAIERALAKIAARPDLAALITVCPERALARARERADGPLAGVPLLVKDIFDTAGIRTTAGSRIFAERVP